MKKNIPVRPQSSPNKGNNQSFAPIPLPSKRKKSKSGKFWGRFFIVSIFVFVALALGSIVGMSLSLTNIPDVGQLQYYHPVETSFIYDSRKNVLARLHDEENRVIIPLKEIPPHVQKAVIAIEDERFREHKGVDPFGLLRALKNNIMGKRLREGGSTITQQLAKNLFLTPERTITRKIAEAWISMQIERKYSKDQILELYLNQVYWGHNSYGIEAASQMYFGKSTKNISLAEGAMLAGLLTGPEIYSPYRNLKLAIFRQKLVLDSMVRNKFIPAADAQKAKKVDIYLKGLGVGYRFPYFTTYVLSILHEKFSESQLREGGLRIYTTVDPDAQAYAEKLMTRSIQRLRRSNIHQGALVSIEPGTGYIRAMVGGTNFQSSQFNRAFQSQRQPGSSFKPFVYLTAFAQGAKPGDVEIDEAVSYKIGTKTWKPKNYGGGYSGPITLQRALERSVNTIAVKLIDKAGVQSVIDTAVNLGIQSPLGHNLSLALGSSEVNLLEMSSAYATIAAGGVRVEPTPILKIEDRNGNILEENTPTPVQVYDRMAVCTLIRVMKGVVLRGTGAAANIGRPAAGKTGTTDDHYDAWFMGFIPQLVTGIWVGNDNPSVMGATGGEVCAPIWADYMSYVTRNMPVRDFPGAEGGLPVLALDSNKVKEKMKDKTKSNEDNEINKDNTEEYNFDNEPKSKKNDPTPFYIEEIKPVNESNSTNESNSKTDNTPKNTPATAVKTPAKAAPTPKQNTQTQQKSVEELDGMIKELESSPGN